MSTGCREVDELLGGGVERGVVLGVSSGLEGSEGRLVSCFPCFFDQAGNNSSLSEASEG